MLYPRFGHWHQPRFINVSGTILTVNTEIMSKMRSFHKITTKKTRQTQVVLLVLRLRLVKRHRGSWFWAHSASVSSAIPKNLPILLLQMVPNPSVLRLYRSFSFPRDFRCFNRKSPHWNSNNTNPYKKSSLVLPLSSIEPKYPCTINATGISKVNFLSINICLNCVSCLKRFHNHFNHFLNDLKKIIQKIEAKKCDFYGLMHQNSITLGSSSGVGGVVAHFFDP